MNQTLNLLEERLDAIPEKNALAKQREFTAEEMRLIEDEHAFDQAFGKWLDFGKRDRIALIRLQKKFELTQKRIRALGYSGRIKREDSNIVIKGTGVWAIIGLFIWSWLLPFAVRTVLVVDIHIKQLGTINTKSLTMTAFAVVLSLISWFAVYGIGTFFIRPWVLEKQTLKANGLPWNARIEGPR